MVLVDVDNWPFKLKNNIMFILPSNIRLIDEDRLEYTSNDILIFLHGKLFIWSMWDDDCLDHVPESSFFSDLIKENPNWCSYEIEEHIQ